MVVENNLEILLASRGGKTLQATTTLSKVLSWENVNTILENPKVHQKLFALIPPSLPKTREELESVIQSSQFRQVPLTILWVPFNYTTI